MTDNRERPDRLKRWQLGLEPHPDSFEAANANLARAGRAFFLQLTTTLRLPKVVDWLGRRLGQPKKG